jgi:acid phosphatase
VEELESRLVLTIPTPAHVVMVIEENHSFSEIIGSPSAPYINSLAQQGALMTNMHAIEHPSQPNYLDLFSGSNQGVTDDSTPHTFSTPNLGSELHAASLTFGGYSESMPSVGYTGSSYANLYFRKHNPWVNFTNVPSTDNMPFSLFPVNFNDLPTVSIVVPNQQNDMHDGTIQTADTWLNNNLSSYVQWAQSNNSLLIVTFDEDDGTEGNRIATIFVGPMVQPGQYSESVNHFNVLRTIEDMYQLPYAGASGSVTPIADIWINATLPTVSITATDSSAAEQGLDSGTFTVTRTGSITSALTVNYSIAGTAGNGTDYTTIASSVTIPAGSPSATISVSPLDDTAVEGTETVILSLQTSALYNIGTPQSATISILDNDVPSIMISDVVVAEGNTGTPAASFTVTLSGPSSQTVTVQYTTADGTAFAGSDYQFAAGTLSFAPGQTSKTIAVNIISDRLPESNETWFVNLSNPINASIADNQGQGTIQDDEPRISISDVTKFEKKSGKTQFTFTISLSAAYDQAVTMSFATMDGTATTADNDYVAQTGTLTFRPGETTKTITIVVKGDSRIESDETFYLDLYGNSSNSLFTKSRGVGTILNDD